MPMLNSPSAPSSGDSLRAVWRRFRIFLPLLGAVLVAQILLALPAIRAYPLLDDWRHASTTRLWALALGAPIYLAIIAVVSARLRHTLDTYAFSRPSWPARGLHAIAGTLFGLGLLAGCTVTSVGYDALSGGLPPSELPIGLHLGLLVWWAAGLAPAAGILQVAHRLRTVRREAAQAAREAACAAARAVASARPAPTTDPASDGRPQT